MATIELKNHEQIKAKAESCAVYPGNVGFTVESPSGKSYLVTVEEAAYGNRYHCTCPNGQYRGQDGMVVGYNACCHAVAVDAAIQ